MYILPSFLWPHRPFASAAANWSWFRAGLAIVNIPVIGAQREQHQVVPDNLVSVPARQKPVACWSHAQQLHQGLQF